MFAEPFLSLHQICTTNEVLEDIKKALGIDINDEGKRHIYLFYLINIPSSIATHPVHMPFLEHACSLSAVFYSHFLSSCTQMSMCTKQTVQLHRESVDKLHQVVDANVKVSYVYRRHRFTHVFQIGNSKGLLSYMFYIPCTVEMLLYKTGESHPSPLCINHPFTANIGFMFMIPGEDPVGLNCCISK